MNDDDRKAFYQTWAAAWEQCGKTVTPTQLNFAYECLRQFDLANVQRAVLAHACDPDVGQYPPKPADIIRQMGGSAEDNSATAWGKVMRAIEQHGPYARIVFDDPVIHAAMQGIGWASLFTLDYQQLAFRQRDFEAAYRASIGAGSYPAVLCGYPLDESELVMIGSPEACQSVYQIGYQSDTKRQAVQSMRQLMQDWQA